MDDRSALYAKRNYPPVNITMPVFNRHEVTLRSIPTVKKNTPTAHTFTVIDNGSDLALRRELIAMYRHGFMDQLFFLNHNYGVSCAANTGWRLCDAPFFMKLDNDNIIQSDTWLMDIFNMWGKNRYRTMFGPVWGLDEEECRLETPWGVYWPLPVSFAGSVFIVSKKVVQTLGYFSEDYGVYGEEDADYCLRGHYAGIRKYTFECSPSIVVDESENQAYEEHDLNKVGLHNSNVGDELRKGIFRLNLFLYENGLRDLNVPLKYHIEEVRAHHVRIKEQPEYVLFYRRLMECLKIFNDPDIAEPQKIERMRDMLDG